MSGERSKHVANKFRRQRARLGTFLCDGCGFQPPMHFTGAARLLHAHHVIPIHAGGVDADSNLVLLCLNCHAIAHLPMADATHVHPRGGVIWVGPDNANELASLFRAARDPRSEDRFFWTGTVEDE